jgi:hypothetical protein
MVDERSDSEPAEPAGRAAKRGARLTLRGELRGFLLLYAVFAAFSVLVAWQCVRSGAAQ